MIAEAKTYDPKEIVTAAADVTYALPADTVAYGEAYNYYVPYESVYKTTETIPVSLAAEATDFPEEYKENMPKYCAELASKIPAFEDKKLRDDVHNLVGQLCDLYLYNNGGNVDYLTTINAFRKSLLDIENKRQKMSAKDQKLLKEYLNSLD